MGHAVRAPWDMLRGLHGTCYEGSIGHVALATCPIEPSQHVAWSPTNMVLYDNSLQLAVVS